MRRPLLLASFFAAVAIGPGCSQTPVVVPARSMERPKDVDFICLEKLDDVTWRGAPIEKCAVNNFTLDPVYGTADGSAPSYHLHAVVTQVSRGELAVADLGIRPSDQGASLVKADPRIAGFNFIPVGAVPTDVAADPNGQAVYVASGHDLRIDVLPAEILRGPIDTDVSSGYAPLPWPHLDFDPKKDGPPSRLVVVNERLYVALPVASGGAKIAVYDLSTNPLLPVRLADMSLSATTSSPISVSSLACDGTGAPPWWTAYDQCFGVQWQPKIPTIDTTGADSLHLASFAVAGDFLFAADDTAPFIHVFDVTNPGNGEIQRIATGGKLSNVSVSDVVPDEATFDNVTEIVKCENNGWVGDGLDHSADLDVKLLPGGQCRAHRYIYAVDFNDPTNGDGSIEVLDVPIHFALNSDGNAILRNPDGTPQKELIDLPGAQLALPIACDSPAFPATRLSLGAFGIGGGSGIPAKAISFMKWDPLSLPPGDGTPGVQGARCIPDNITTTSTGSKHYAESIAWPLGTDNASWPTRLRGEFAFVVLDNGSLVVVDIDDYDAVCRGPGNTATDFLDFFSGVQSKPPRMTGKDATGNATPAGLGVGASGEWLGRPVRRNHPRSLRLFDTANLPAVSDAILTTINSTVSVTPTTNATGANVQPHLVPLHGVVNSTTTTTILSSADNPYTTNNETWTATFQGSLPGFVYGSAGTLQDDGATFLDPGGNFCNRGVEAFGSDIATHDYVQIIDDVCAGPNDPNGFAAQCTQAQHDACVTEFGLSTDLPLDQTRDLVIGSAFNDHVSIVASWQKQNDGTIALKDGISPDIKACFPGLAKYTVRAGNGWVVVGTSTGFLHRVQPQSTDPSAPCVIDSTLSMIQEGRAFEIPPPPKGQTQATLDGRAPPDLCKLFVNPVWEFAIQTGFDDSNVPVESVRDMRLTFAAHFSFQPFGVNIGSLPTAVRPLVSLKNGVDTLQWGQIATIDAIDNGLQIMSIDDLNNTLGGQFHEFQ